MADNSATFPLDEALFADDPRIYFSRETNSHHLEDDNGEDWEFIPRAQHWIQSVGEDQRNAFDAQYKIKGVQDDVEQASTAEKRKAGEDARTEAVKKQKKNESRRDGLNKAIYVTGLPLDTDEDEIFNVFSKYGLIDESWDTDKPRIKMYEDDRGEFKGEALIVYFKPESVNQAITMLDGTDFRHGVSVDGDLRVTVADYSFKANDVAGVDNKKETKRKPLSDKDRQKIKAKQEEMNKRLNWNDSDEEDEDPMKIRSSRWERLIILKGMFTPEALAKDPDFYHELKEDIREQCELHGRITAIVIYDEEPEGIATVRFASVDDADSAVKAINGRKYDGNIISARTSTGTERFKKSKGGHSGGQDDEARLEAYRQSISTGT